MGAYWILIIDHIDESRAARELKYCTGRKSCRLAPRSFLPMSCSCSSMLHCVSLSVVLCNTVALIDTKNGDDGK